MVKQLALLLLLLKILLGWVVRRIAANIET